MCRAGPADRRARRRDTDRARRSRDARAGARARRARCATPRAPRGGARTPPPAPAAGTVRLLADARRPGAPTRLVGLRSAVVCGWGLRACISRLLGKGVADQLLVCSLWAQRSVRRAPTCSSVFARVGLRCCSVGRGTPLAAGAQLLGSAGCYVGRLVRS